MMPRPFAPRVLLCLALATCPPLFAQSTTPPPGTAPTEASPALVNHLVAQLEKREQPPAGGLFGAAPSPGMYFETEQQLRRLGARAQSAAPRIAELLSRTERHAYELGWTLWSISAEPPAEELPALAGALADARGVDRLVALSRVGRTKSPAAMPLLREAAASQEAAQRLIAAIALSYQKDAAAGAEPIELMAAMLKDRERAVRQAALNGLRLQGPRAASVSAALIEHLRTRDNVWMTAQVLAVVPTRELLPLKPELEQLLGDKKLSEFQKQPVVELLLRIENHTPTPAAAPAAPGVPTAPSVRSPSAQPI